MGKVTSMRVFMEREIWKKCLYREKKTNLRREQKQHNPFRAEIASLGLFLE